MSRQLPVMVLGPLHELAMGISWDLPWPMLLEQDWTYLTEVCSVLWLRMPPMLNWRTRTGLQEC